MVIAAGPYSGRVAALAGVDLPLRIIRRHRVTIGQHPLIPQDAPMVIDQDTGAHWRPEKPGAALAWAQTHEPPGEPLDDVPANPRFVHEVLEGVYRLCPFWLDVAESLRRDQVTVQAGQYTVTPDDKPIIGPHPQIAGLYFNTGYSGHGIMGAPGGGRLLADLVSGQHQRRRQRLQPAPAERVWLRATITSVCSEFRNRVFLCVHDLRVHRRLSSHR